jgi:hypothetical protein
MPNVHGTVDYVTVYPGLMAAVTMLIGVGAGLLCGGSFRHHALQRVSCRKTWQCIAMYALNLCETKVAVNNTTLKLCP